MECQALCRSVPGAKHFSHYNKGDDYREAEMDGWMEMDVRDVDDDCNGRNDYEGRCGCFSTCPYHDGHGCHTHCGDDDDLAVRDGGKCHCMR